MKRVYTLLLAIALTSSVSFSQINLLENFQVKKAKNTISISGGTIILASSANLAYERMLLSSKSAVLHSLWIKGRASSFGNNDWIESDHKYLIDLAAVGLIGQTRMHMELSLGIGMFPIDNQFFPTLSAGYRYQKDKGGFIFRTGLGYPEFLYIGLGYGF